MSYTAIAKFIKKSKSFVKKCVDRYDANKTVDDLPERSKSRILGVIWQELPTDYAEKLVESMPKRCQAILDNDGNWTIY